MTPARGGEQARTRMVRRSSHLGRWLSLASLLLLLSALSSPGARAQSNGARIAFLHLSADAPALDIYIDGGRAVGSLNFSESSAYLGVTAGSHQVEVTPAARLDVLAST